MTSLEALAIPEAVSGRTARRSHLPIAMAKLIGKLGGLLNPGLGYLMETMASEGAARDSTAPPDRHVTPSTIFDHVARAWANDLAATSSSLPEPAPDLAEVIAGWFKAAAAGDAAWRDRHVSREPGLRITPPSGAGDA
jgi:hypothetical protein